MIFFKKSEPFTDTHYPDQFPDQRIALQDLLYNKDIATNPLIQKCEDDEIRYFHLPSNNMEWIEEAMARYYHEDRPGYDGLFRRPKDPSKTYMLLRPEFWRGQQHGGRHDAIHARHMRPRCDIISTDPEHLEDSPKNLVLLMPYLHWETDRQRTKFDETMRNICESRAKQAKEEYDKAHAPPRVQSNGSANPSLANGAPREAISEQRLPLQHLESEFRMINTTTEAFDAAMQHEVETFPQSTFSKTTVAKKLTSKGILAPNTQLGKILHRAALLSEAMDNY